LKPAEIDQRNDDSEETIGDPRVTSFAEGLKQDKTFPVAGPPPAAEFRGDRVTITFQPSDQERFLVVNALYHPRWRAHAAGRRLPIYPTNVVMRGVIVPPGVERIDMVYEPFISSPLGLGIMGGSILMTIVCAMGLGQLGKSDLARRWLR
jgi:hypothetical protein